jgi:hypothetical protein
MDLMAPWLRRWSAATGSKQKTVSARATTNGTFTVVLTGGTGPVGGVGDYRLTLVKTGEPFITSTGDEGGPLTNGFVHTGMIELGDADVWSFQCECWSGNISSNGKPDD